MRHLVSLQGPLHRDNSISWKSVWPPTDGTIYRFYSQLSIALIDVAEDVTIDSKIIFSEFKESGAFHNNKTHAYPPWGRIVPLTLKRRVGLVVSSCVIRHSTGWSLTEVQKCGWTCLVLTKFPQKNYSHVDSSPRTTVDRHLCYVSGSATY